MHKKIDTFLKTYWLHILILFSIVGIVCNILIFYPGYMSNDSIGQLGQAMGRYELTDLTPIASVLLWKLLLHMTHQVSSMLILQLFMLWLSLLLFSVFIYRTTKSRLLSSFALCIGILPFVINISGVIWKDNQMAFPLLLASVILLYFRYISSKKWRMLLLSIVTILIVYAGLVRYNAIVALIPLIFLGVHESRVFIRQRSEIGFTIIITLCIAGMLQFLTLITHAKQSGPLTGLVLDDIVNVATDKDLGNSSLPSPLVTSLRSVKMCAADKKLLLNTFWSCTNATDRTILQYTYHKQQLAMWPHIIQEHFPDYVGYRIEMFLLFLFPPDNVYFVWQQGIVRNELGQQVKFDRLGQMTSIYVNNFGYKTFRPLYEPWTWLIIGVVLMYLSRRMTKTYKAAVFGVSLSSVLYILSYFPTGATVDYRYIYWSVIGSLFCILVILIDRNYSHRIKNHL